MDAGDVGDVGAVAQHYGERRALSAAERRRSLIRSLRELNNWVKSTQILASVRPGDFVLDLACGKGGDLPKWKEARIGAYAAVDVALASVRADLRNRYNLGRHPFPAALFVADCFAADLCVAVWGLWMAAGCFGRQRAAAGSGVGAAPARPPSTSSPPPDDPPPPPRPLQPRRAAARVRPV